MSGFAVALGIGLGLGIERERHKGRGAGREAAGVRTFALVALLGAASVRVGGTALLALAFAFVGTAAVASYVYSDHSDPGLTTEVALVLDLLLGGLAQTEPALAAAAVIQDLLSIAVYFAIAARVMHISTAWVLMCRRGVRGRLVVT